MAIQMRRGLRKDFDPNKMLPGEWAVSIDSNTSNQIVWMCFAAGVCKRMGTYEDFQSQISEITEDIRDYYVSDLDKIKEDIELIANTVLSDKEEILIIKSDIVTTYLPQIKDLAEKAEESEASAEVYAINSFNSATLSQSYAVGGTGTRNGENTDNAKYYADEAKKSAENAAEIAGGDFLSKTGDVSNTTVVFEKSTDRANIKSGENLRTLFGKIMKWLGDLTAPAFAQMISAYTDLMSNTVAGYVPDALAVKEGFNAIDSDLDVIGQMYSNCSTEDMTLSEDAETTITSIKIPTTGTYLIIGKLGYNATLKTALIYVGDLKLVYEENISSKSATLIKAVTVSANTVLSLKAKGSGVIGIDNRINFIQAIRLK